VARLAIVFVIHKHKLRYGTTPFVAQIKLFAPQKKIVVILKVYLCIGASKGKVICHESELQQFYILHHFLALENHAIHLGLIYFKNH
jgi:hypothetical protein